MQSICVEAGAIVAIVFATALLLIVIRSDDELDQSRSEPDWNSARESAATLGIGIGVGWLLLRIVLIVRRRRANVTLFSLGTQPRGSSKLTGAQFPVQAAEAEAFVDEFLACKGVDINNRGNAVRTFVRTQRSSAFRLQRHMIKVGRTYYKISKEPLLASLTASISAPAPRTTLIERSPLRGSAASTVAEVSPRAVSPRSAPSRIQQLAQCEYMAGYSADISWVHTAQWGRSTVRLITHWRNCLLCSLVGALVLFVILLASGAIASAVRGDATSVRHEKEIWSIFSFLAVASFLGTAVWWWVYMPSWAEFGYRGMTENNNHGKEMLYVESERRSDLALTLLENKLGRAPSPRVIRRWEWKPVSAEVIGGSHEELVVYEDTIMLKTRTIIPRMCCKCCKLADEDEYYMLLQDINFIEAGGIMNPVLSPIAMLFLAMAFAVFLAADMDFLWVWLTSPCNDGNVAADAHKFLWTILLALFVLLVALSLSLCAASGNDEWNTRVWGTFGLMSFVGLVVAIGWWWVYISSAAWADVGLCGFTDGEMDGTGSASSTSDTLQIFKLELFCILFGISILCYLFASRARQSYILISVTPGGSERGNRNRFAGTSPFYIRQKSDTDEVRYQQICKLLRSAANTSRNKSRRARHEDDDIRSIYPRRSTLRFQAAVRTLLAARRMGWSWVGNGLAADIEWNPLQIQYSGRIRKSIREADGSSATEVGPGSKMAALTACICERATAMSHSMEERLHSSGGGGLDDLDSRGVQKIFVEMDTDSDGIVNFDEFSEWLQRWMENTHTVHTNDELKQLHKVAATAFESVLRRSLDTADTRISTRISSSSNVGLKAPEFRDFMEHGGVIDILKRAELWDAMSFANLFEFVGFGSCFDRYDVDHDGRMDIAELTSALLDLNLHPSPTEIERLLYTFDDNHSGSLEKDEFCYLCLQYLKQQDAFQEKFEAPNWSPLNLSGLELDFLPWGSQETTVTRDNITTLGNNGLCGRSSTSAVSSNSIEMVKTRWLHIEGNAVPIWKCNLYVVEMVLVYTLFKDHATIADRVNRFAKQRGWSECCDSSTGMDAHARTTTTPAEVFAFAVAMFIFVLRIASLFARKRAIATAFALSKPTQSKQQQNPKCQFPVKIDDIESLAATFLHAKGIQETTMLSTGASTDIYRTKLPGYGFLPLNCVNARGIHTASFGRRHFKLEKVSGGGGKRLSRRLANVDYMVGMLEDIRWVHIEKRGKSIFRLVAGLSGVVVSGAAALVPFITTFVSRSSCFERLSELDHGHCLVYIVVPLAVWTTIGWILVVLFWLFYSPVIAELGVMGVDLNSWRGHHCAEFRISRKFLFERIFLPTFAKDVLNKISDAKEAIGADESAATNELDIRSRWQRLGLIPPPPEDKHKSKSPVEPMMLLEDSTAAEELAETLFDLMDVKRLGCVSIDDLQAWNDAHYSQRSNKDWIHDAHQSMIQTFAEERKVAVTISQRGNGGGTKSIVPVVEMQLQRMRRTGDTDRVDQWVTSPRDSGDSTHRTSSFRATQSLEDSIHDAEDLSELGGLTFEEVALYDREKERAQLMEEIGDLEALLLTESTRTAHQNKRRHRQKGRLAGKKSRRDDSKLRIERSIASRERKLEVLDQSIEALKHPELSQISRRNYVLKFMQASSDKQSPINSHLTRSRVAISILQRKLARPLSHQLLRRWEFKPAAAYYCCGQSQELLLHQDYVSLRLRSQASFSALCLCCCRNAAENTSDYCVLHADCYFIETGTAVMGGVDSLFAAVGWIFVLGLVSTVSWMLSIVAEIDRDPAVHSSDQHDRLVSACAWGAVASILPGVLVCVVAFTGMLRKPYLHIGTSPGGGARGRSNTLGSSSPFYIMLARGTKLDDARTLADWIRGAAILSRQRDITHARKLQRQKQKHGNFGPGEDVANMVAAAHHGAKMEHHMTGSEKLAHDHANTGDVLGGELVHQVEHGMMVETFKLLVNFSWESLLNYGLLVFFIIGSFWKQIEEGHTIQALVDVIGG